MNYITKILDNERNSESICFLYLIKETGRSSDYLPDLRKILRQLGSVLLLTIHVHIFYINFSKSLKKQKK